MVMHLQILDTLQKYLVLQHLVIESWCLKIWNSCLLTHRDDYGINVYYCMIVLIRFTILMVLASIAVDLQFKVKLLWHLCISECKQQSGIITKQYYLTVEFCFCFLKEILEKCGIKQILRKWWQIIQSVINKFNKMLICASIFFCNYFIAGRSKNIFLEPSYSYASQSKNQKGKVFLFRVYFNLFYVRFYMCSTIIQKHLNLQDVTGDSEGMVLM